MKVKRTIGIGLMLLSVGLMVLWETAGRQYITEETVLIAACDIHKGELLDPSCFAAGSFRKEFLPEGAVLFSYADSFSGLYALRDIGKNEILTEEAVCTAEKFHSAKESVFAIPQDWIASCSCALRRNDRVRIVCLTDRSTVGIYQVAFVRDTGGQEPGQEEVPYANLRQRTTGPKDIGTVEIICTEKEYFKLYDLAENYRLNLAEGAEAAGCFLLIPEDVL